MRACKTLLAGMGVGLFLIASAGAQTTNPPTTYIENFELQTGTILIKGFSPVGSVSLGDSTVSVRVKATADVWHTQKVYGIQMVLTRAGSQSGGAASREVMVVDYDELDALASALEYLGKITYEVTPLTGFDASFTTRSGIRFSAHSERRQGGIQQSVRFGDGQKVLLTTEQLNQLRNLVTQAKSTLDAIK